MNVGKGLIGRKEGKGGIRDCEGDNTQNAIYGCVNC